jgi:hypothetical protein
MPVLSVQRQRASVRHVRGVRSATRTDDRVRRARPRHRGSQLRHAAQLPHQVIHADARTIASRAEILNRFDDSIKRPRLAIQQSQRRNSSNRNSGNDAKWNDRGGSHIRNKPTASETTPPTEDLTQDPETPALRRLQTRARGAHGNYSREQASHRQPRP